MTTTSVHNHAILYIPYPDTIHGHPLSYGQSLLRESYPVHIWNPAVTSVTVVTTVTSVVVVTTVTSVTVVTTLTIV